MDDMLYNGSKENIIVDVNSPLIDTNLCRKAGKEWDSILVVSPYTIDDSIKSFSIQNYSAVKREVNIQSTVDWTYTLLFVKNRKYVGIGVFQRNEMNLSDMNDNRVSWITDKNCHKLVAKVGIVDGKTRYSVEYKQ